MSQAWSRPVTESFQAFFYCIFTKLESIAWSEITFMTTKVNFYLIPLSLPKALIANQACWMLEAIPNVSC